MASWKRVSLSPVRNQFKTTYAEAKKLEILPIFENLESGLDLEHHYLI